MRSLADGRPALRPPPPLDELRSRREEILAICARHGASNIRVFGSVATGEADENSDLDLLVDMERGRSLLTSPRSSEISKTSWGALSMRQLG
jgi:predicted nucleotidyltransferase